jgi:hypothetical protein
MAIRRKGKKLFADAQADIAEALRDYSSDSYPASRFADAVCTCGQRTFVFAVDDQEGAAERQCVTCDTPALMANSTEVEDEMELEQCECPCGKDVFELTLGLALYADSDDDVRWIYVGARCIACGQVGCYSDWKCDGDSAQDLLARA